MTVTLVDSNSQTAVISTEHTLFSTTAEGVYILEVDMANLATGDTVKLRAKTKVRTADTTRVLMYEDLSGAQDETTGHILARFEPIAVDADVGLAFTLEQSAGTGRAFPWKVIKVS